MVLLQSRSIGNAAEPSLLAKRLKSCLVIGGDGFLGHHLTQAIHSQGCEVSILSHSCTKEIPPTVQVFLGDIQNLESLLAAMKNVDTVFHTASLILSNRYLSEEMREYVYQVNVQGTLNVITACQECGVSRLIYTSSNNVVFDQEIIQGNESLPYATGSKDIYTQTKLLAEKEVLKANQYSKLRTCALRPGGIYGPGDHLILLRLLQALKRGRFLMTIGNPAVLADSVFVENLVHAHLLAAINLARETSTAAGQAYFISDDEPSNYFLLMKPIVEGLGYKFPRFSIPFSVAYPLAWILELFHWLLEMPQPFLTMMEVKKVSLSNYFSIEKAKQELGYRPVVSQKEGIEKSLPYCSELFSKIEIVERPAFVWWMSVLGGMTLLGILAFHLKAFHLFHEQVPFFSQLSLQILFILAVLTHAGEAFYAMRIAQKKGLADLALGWGLQTFLLGYPSLRLLLQRISKPYDG